MNNSSWPVFTDPATGKTYDQRDPTDMAHWDKRLEEFSVEVWYCVKPTQSHGITVENPVSNLHATRERAEKCLKAGLELRCGVYRFHPLDPKDVEARARLLARLNDRPPYELAN